jgi:5-methylcytosine-specific restriction endonuclease McrA
VSDLFCGKKLDFSDAQFGHKKAWAKGGSTTLENTLLLCYGCNKLQRTESVKTIKRKLGINSVRHIPKIFLDFPPLDSQRFQDCFR